MTATEIEEEAVRKRRAEGTPCNEENFYAWKKSFELAMAAMSESATDAIEKENLKKKEKKEDVSGRITGFEHFSGKGGMLNLEAIEAAAMLEDHVDSLEINEELFEGDDDLDDLDFDDNDDSESNSSEDDGDPDI